MIADRGAAVAALVKEVNATMLTLAPVSDTQFGSLVSLSAADFATAQNNIKAKTNPTLRQLEASALLYRLMGDQKYLIEAVRRGDELAAMSATGPTSYTNQDQVDRGIEMTLMICADMLWDSVNATGISGYASLAPYPLAGGSQYAYDSDLCRYARQSNTGNGAHGLYAL